MNKMEPPFFEGGFIYLTIPFKVKGYIVSNFDIFLFAIRKICLTTFPESLYSLGLYFVFM